MRIPPVGRIASERDAPMMEERGRLRCVLRRDRSAARSRSRNKARAMATQFRFSMKERCARALIENLMQDGQLARPAFAWVPEISIENGIVKLSVARQQMARAAGGGDSGGGGATDVPQAAGAYYPWQPAPPASGSMDGGNWVWGTQEMGEEVVEEDGAGGGADVAAAAMAEATVSAAVWLEIRRQNLRPQANWIIQF